ncbi:MAG: NADH-quinone oxidoreductase subunit H [Archaeoglobi archaeon]|nr:NADH-quinone oxidoreductase subunit H [Candidatus Mnemosynella sp.]
MNFAEALIGLFVFPGFLFLFIFGLLFQGINRKLIARLQGRYGPPVIQPFYDFLKLLGKENVVPRNANSFWFNIAPVIAVASVVTLMLYIPVGYVGPLSPVLSSGFGDLIVILYLFALPAIALIIGASASGSPYAAIGAQRELSMLISYEFPLAIAIFALAWRAGTFDIAEIFVKQPWTLGGPLNALGFLLIFLTALSVIPGKVGVGAFDIPEAKEELAGGPLVEYSGRNLALFELAHYMKMFVASAFVVALFLGAPLSPLLGLSGASAILIDVIWFLFKVFIVIFLTVTLVAAVTARLKITQAVTFYWFVVDALAIVGLILIAVDYFFLSGVM